jgi:hypothetical protein
MRPISSHVNWFRFYDDHCPSELQNPLLKKYGFDPYSFLEGSKEGFIQVHKAIASADFYNHVNGCVCTLVLSSCRFAYFSLILWLYLNYHSPFAYDSFIITNSLISFIIKIFNGNFNWLSTSNHISMYTHTVFSKTRNRTGYCARHCTRNCTSSAASRTKR